MAETSAQDVSLKEAQSVAVPSPADDLVNYSSQSPAGNGQATTNDIPSTSDNVFSSDGRAGDADGASEATLTAVVDTSDGGADDLLGGGSEAATTGLGLSESLAQALADASGGSDTDTSRNDMGDANKDGKGHVRTGSVKKPASFKPVSVTKSFLAKSLSASPVPRPGDKGVASSPSPVSALQSAKPRLVAKSALGGNGRGLTKMNGTSGPDASKVWNKNRPAPVPAPRQFTDEELQTRYGIHMTARLQSDEAGKDSKWADIDDDEDDWAPETVEWMDGTKSNVGATDARAPPLKQEDRGPSPDSVDRPAEAVKPILASMHKPSVSQTTKTILRPGAQLSSSPKPGLAQKSGLDKTGSSSSKPAPTPAKSPWAALPPVEKVAPINPPIQQSQRPFQRDPQGFDALPPAPSPAQEIAADDFSRTLRDDRGTKELFNAHSGRYEPANEARRGSRHEQGYRQPAVLQRPPQGAMSNGPAEPSAAFQTHRSSIEGGAPWQRRRASSNLSAAGGRRPSFAGSQEYAPGAHDIAVESPKAGFASLDRSGPWMRQQQPPSEPPLVEREAPSDVPQQPIEDPVAKQQRMMKEKIERARAAKQKELEAEAAEMAARQERLRLKMEQLAAASPSPDASAKGTGTAAPTSQPPKALAVSPPKPPVPTSAGEVAQYGMMKVHQPHPVKKNIISEASLTSKSNHDLSGGQSQGFRGSASPNKASTGPASSQPPQHGDRSSHKALPAAPSTTAPLEKLGGSWKTSPSPNDYNWGTNTMAARSAVGASVWGPPLSNEKSLGNGTFESKFSHPNFNNRFDNTNRAGLTSQGPLHGPIGSGIKGAHTPPSASQRQSNFAQTFQSLSSESSTQQEHLPVSKPVNSPSVDDQAFASAHLDSSLQQSIAQSSSLHPQTAAPLASSAYNGNHMSSAQVALPPAAATGGRLNTQGRSRDWIRQGATTTSGWNAFHANEQQQMRADIEQYQNDLQRGSRPAAKSTGIVTYEVYREASGNRIEHVHIAVHPDGKKATTKIGDFEMSENNIAIMRKSELDHPEDHPLRLQQGLVAQSPAPAASASSRFFPKTQTAAPPTTTPSGNVHPVNDENEAPPPAEQGLFEHDTSQPAKVKFPLVAKVNLPGMKVSLPPRSPGLDKTFGARNTFQPPTGPARAKPTLMHAADLEAKFGHLRAGGVNGFASSKPSFDISTANARPTAVKAPTASTARTPKSLFATDKSAESTSKSIAEDECIDFPDFGSKPTVRIPTVPHKNHSLGYSYHSEMLAPAIPRPNARFQKMLETQSVQRDEAFLFLEYKSNKSLTVKLSGMPTAKTVAIQPKHMGSRSPGAAVSPSGSAGGFRGGRGGFAPRGARRDNGFAPQFVRGSNHARDSNAGPSSARGGPGRSRGGHSGGSSGTSSPKPRGPRNDSAGTLPTGVW